MFNRYKLFEQLTRTRWRVEKSTRRRVYIKKFFITLWFKTMNFETEFFFCMIRVIHLFFMDLPRRYLKWYIYTTKSKSIQKLHLIYIIFLSCHLIVKLKLEKIFSLNIRIDSILKSVFFFFFEKFENRIWRNDISHKRLFLGRTFASWPCRRVRAISSS